MAERNTGGDAESTYTTGGTDVYDTGTGSDLGTGAGTAGGGLGTGAPDYGTDAYVGTGTYVATTETGGQSGDRLQEAATSVAERARQTTGTQVTTRVDQAVGQATQTLEQVANAVRQTGQTLRERDQAPIGNVADQAAEQVERAAGYLRGRDANQLLRDAEDFARRQPAIFLGGALAAGWFVARFLKSSPPESGGGGREVRVSVGYPATEAGTWRESGLETGVSDARP